MQHKMIILIAEEFKALGIDTYYVGGCVRDEILGIQSDDIDVCLVNVKDKKTVTVILEQHCKHVLPEKGSFPVWICNIEGLGKVEFALARTEKLVGDKRTDFVCSTEHVTIEQDLERRDITVNSIAQNVLTGELIDPFGGIYDLEQCICRNTSDAFKDDTLRVIRAARFCATLHLAPTVEFVDMVRELKPTDISNERVGMELMKLFKNSDSPSTFFYMLGWWGWLEYHFKELAALSGVPQSLKHHPEGDAFVHTMYCLDQVPKGNWFMRAVMLCHDLGKATHTLIDGVKWHEVKDDIGDFRLWSKDIKVSSPGHEAAGIQLCYDMLKRISFCSHSIIRKMGCLVKNHMVRAFYNPAKPDKVVRPILRDLMQHGLSYNDLGRTVYYDLAGRPPLQVPDSLDIGQAYAEYLIINDLMTPVVTGELLMANGIEPSEVMGKMVKRALELQDRGTLNKDNWKKVLRGGGFKEYFKPELAPSGDIVEDGDIYPLYMDDPHYDDMQSIIKDPEQG